MLNNEELLKITENEIKEFACTGEWDDGYIDYDRGVLLKLLYAQRESLLKSLEENKKVK